MAKRFKTSRQRAGVQNAKENQKFLIVVAIATLVLVGLMYVIFR